MTKNAFENVINQSETESKSAIIEKPQDGEKVRTLQELLADYRGQLDTKEKWPEAMQPFFEKSPGSAWNAW